MAISNQIHRESILTFFYSNCTAHFLPDLVDVVLVLHLIREDLLLEFSKPLNLRVQLRQSHLKPRPATAKFSSVLQPSPLTGTTTAPHKDRKGHLQLRFYPKWLHTKRSNHGRVFRKPVHGTDPKLNNHRAATVADLNDICLSSSLQIHTLAQTLTPNCQIPGISTKQWTQTNTLGRMRSPAGSTVFQLTV